MGSSEESRALEQPPPLKSHKTFPRRGLIIPSIEIVQPVSPDQNEKLTAKPAPPLTPPGAGQEVMVHEKPTQTRTAAMAGLPTTEMLTPHRASKPPTPDVTPPRMNNSFNKHSTLNQSAQFSSSPRADSFQTACESISSEDMETPVHMSRSAAQTPRQREQLSKTPASNGYPSQSADIKPSPPSASQQLSETEYDTGFESFDGTWAPTPIESPTTLVGKRKSKRSHAKSAQQTVADKDALDMKHLNASLVREKLLRDRINDAQVARQSPSMEQFRESIGWPAPEGPTKDKETEARPVSVISSTSTIEAMIIDTPKRAQRTLRHSEKRSSLRSASSPITKLERSAHEPLPDSHHRLVHKSARISPKDPHRSSPEMPLPARALSIATRPETIRVVVIPERKSSLKSGPNSNASSKRGSRRSSGPIPTTSTKHTETLRQEKRVISDSVLIKTHEADTKSRSMQRTSIPLQESSPSAPTSRNNSRPTSLASASLRNRPTEGPVIPARSSSLSAPTSRNNSRATSLTSESLRSHNLAMDLEMHKRRGNHPISPPRNNVLDSNERQGPSQVSHVPGPPVTSGDMDMLHPPALPFVQGSVQSSSPGPIEIQEATAVSLFAHNNHSLLLVNPRERPSTRHLQALGISNGLGYPCTPEDQTKIAAICVDSPLKNPRPPLKPPISKPLPPLPPQNREASDENDESKGLGRRWSSVRSWSVRPRSDSFNTIARSFSMKAAKNRTAGKQLDSRLHPFWRPRGFWEDVSGSPEKQLSPARRASPAPSGSLIVSNTLGLPQRRIIFDGPPSLAHRSPEMKRLLDGMTSTGSLVDQGMFRTASPLHPARFQLLSRWSLWLQAIQWRNVRARLQRMRQRRDERKRAARRDALKQSIGAPTYVASSATAGVVTR